MVMPRYLIESSYLSFTVGLGLVAPFDVLKSTIVVLAELKDSPLLMLQSPIFLRQSFIRVAIF